MIPIRDTIPARNYPIVTHVIIGVNVAVYLLQLTLGSGLDRFIYIYGLVPARYTIPQLAAYFTVGQQAFSFLSFMFLHGGFWHLLGNMWSLYIFGDNVEDRLGPGRYLLFYLICGLASGMTHLLLNSHSNVPTIGASGAIAGVMGAYFILHPRSRILTLIPIFFIPYFIELPAYFFLGVWFLLQTISAAGSAGAGGGIAWWAHVGGFVCGIVFLKLLEMMPKTGLARPLEQVTRKKTTHRLQFIRPTGSDESPHLYGRIRITPHEAFAGARKLLSIPRGFQKHMFRVTVPPGVKEGSVLRLKGLGREIGRDERGDLFLQIVIQS
jgi:membrane associated rhomboid family serine protease